jgi:hypothetical protein
MAEERGAAGVGKEGDLNDAMRDVVERHFTTEQLASINPKTPAGRASLTAMLS